MNLFKKAPKEIVVVEKEVKQLTEKEQTNKIIEEIHAAFYSEVDNLLQSAKISNSLETDKSELIEKCGRLKALGFMNTKEVMDAQAEIQRLEKLKQENEKKKMLIEAINYFGFRYPIYKFITEDSVKKICEKYNLIYGAIDRYIGTVPDKNLKQIEDFKVIEDDECYVMERTYTDRWVTNTRIKKTYKTYQDHVNDVEKMKTMNGDEMHKYFMLGGNENVVNMKSPLEIAAPLKDFNMTGNEVKDFKISEIVIPDPIVLKPVIYNRQKHYLIVTAWGLEASDPIVVNAINN